MIAPSEFPSDGWFAAGVALGLCHRRGLDPQLRGQLQLPRRVDGHRVLIAPRHVQIDAQLRERRRHFSRRIEAVLRIEQAAGGLDERIGELQAQQAKLRSLDTKLAQLTDQLLAAQQENSSPTAAPV